MGLFCLGGFGGGFECFLLFYVSMGFWLLRGCYDLVVNFGGYLVVLVAGWG